MTSVRPLHPRSQRAWDEFRAKLADSGGIVLETSWLGSHKGHLVRCSAGHKYKPAPREVGGTFVCGMCFARCGQAGCREPVRTTKAGRSLGFCAEHLPTSPVRPVGSRKTDAQGYVTVKLEDGRIIGEHRLVMSRHIGRDLITTENVHHINGDRGDNRVENLELWYSPQPYGQRVADLLQYAVTHHREALLGLLAAKPSEDTSPCAA